MKHLLKAATILIIGTTTGGNLSGIVNCDVISQKNMILNVKAKTSQNTIYIDENGNKKTTSKHDLSSVNSKEVIQIGFYKNKNNKIQAVQMPITIKKVPTQLPKEITTIKGMFKNTKQFNQDISNWDTTRVHDMSYLFRGALAFNQNLANWNTAKVIYMNHMFDHAIVFNQNIGNWNTARVEDMSYMFQSALKFNQNLGKWKTGNVFTMSHMFNSAWLFNQDLSKWNVKKIEYHGNFATGSKISKYPAKLPKFKK